MATEIQAVLGLFGGDDEDVVDLGNAEERRVDERDEEEPEGPEVGMRAFLIQAVMF
jgi:hypothetical protein